MPGDGIYLSNDTYQKLQGDLFEQDSRGTIADAWQQQATTAIPGMVADAQDRADQAQRNSMADQFLASAPDIAAQHVATLTSPESPQNAPSLTPPSEPSHSATVPPDIAPTQGAAGVVDTAAPLVPTPPAAPTVSTSAAPTATPAAGAPQQRAPATGYEAVARAAAQKYGIDPDIFARQISQESGFDPNAVSPAGARGIAQFMPDTARGLGINPDDPEQALDGAARYMAQLIQTNGGDVSKALAAYNAGQGNVDKYGGIPPFEETKRYVANIMGGAGQAIASVAQGVQQAIRDPSSILDAVKPFLGQSYVWGGKTAQSGFDCSGLAGYLAGTGQPESTTSLYAKSTPISAADARPGDLVFYNMNQPDMAVQHVATVLDPSKGTIVQSGGTQHAVNIGEANQAVGSAPEYRRIGPGGAPVQAATAPANVQTTQPTDQVAASATAAQPQSMWDKLGSGISDVFKNIFGGAAQMQAGQEAQTRGTVQAAEGVGGAAVNTLAGAGSVMQQGMDVSTPGYQAANQFRAENFPSVLDPNHPVNVATDLEKKYGTWMPSDKMTPDDQARAESVMLAFGGLAGPVGGKYDEFGVLKGFEPPNPKYYPGTLEPIADAAPKATGWGVEPTGPQNPFQLHAEPGPNRTLLTPDQAAQHLEDLTTRYQSNDSRINQLEAQLHGGDLGSTGVVRPPGTIGWTDNEVVAYAQLHGLSPYSTQGWGSMAGDAQYIAAHKPSVPSAPKQTPTQARAELAQLRAENEQISNAAEHAIDNGAGPLYRPEGPTTSDLPWDYNAPGGPATAAAENTAGAAARGSPADTGYAPQGAGAASSARAPAAPAQSQLAAPYPSYPAPPPAPPAAEPQVATDTLQGLLGMAKARGVDTSAFEAQLPKGALPEPISTSAPTAPATSATGPLSLKPVTAAPPGGAPPPPPPGPATPTYPPPPPPPTGVAAAVGAVPPSPPTGGASPWDFVRALRKGSLAGGIPTMTHIILNSPLQTAWKLLGDVPTAVVTGHPETIPLEFMGAWQGLRGWASNAATTLTTPNSFGLAAKMGGGTGAQALETGLLGLVKTHPVIQDMARQLGTSMELWRQAGVEATNAGMARFSAPWWQEVQRLVAQPTAAMSEAASATGETFALGGKMGKQGQALANWLNEDGNNIGHLIVPFYNIGYHVAVQGIERSPLGAIGTFADMAKLAAGKGPYAGGAVAEGVTPLALRIRNNAIGTGLAIEAFQQAALGNITGNGPDDPKLKADLLATGWQPDSIRIGGRYFGLHVLGPLGWPLATAANLYEATHTGDQGGYAKPKATTPEQFVDFASRMGQYGENETFLQGIAQILQGVGSSVQSGRIAEREAASMLTSLIPQGGLLSNAASIVDPNMRRLTPGDIGQAVQNRLPGERQSLPLKLTPTGQPMPNPQQGLGILLPRSSIANPDPVITAMGQAGVGAPTLPKTISVTSKYQMDLTPSEQQRFEELHGKALNELLKEDVTDADWKALSIERQRQLIQRATAKATDVARKQLLDELPDDQIESRLVLKTDAQAGNRVTVFGAP